MRVEFFTEHYGFVVDYLAMDDHGKVGLYRLEVGCAAGTGKLRVSGGIDSTMRESLQRAFVYLQRHKVNMGIAQTFDTTDFHVEANKLPRSKLRGIKRKKHCLGAKQASGNRTLQRIDLRTNRVSCE
jgi:predicted ATP-dependent Lon-type protease